jgi:hypothetical protein
MRFSKCGCTTPTQPIPKSIKRASETRQVSASPFYISYSSISVIPQLKFISSYMHFALLIPIVCLSMQRWLLRSLRSRTSASKCLALLEWDVIQDKSSKLTYWLSSHSYSWMQKFSDSCWPAVMVCIDNDQDTRTHEWKKFSDSCWPAVVVCIDNDQDAY